MAIGGYLSERLRPFVYTLLLCLPEAIALHGGARAEAPAPAPSAAPGVRLARVPHATPPPPETSELSAISQRAPTLPGGAPGPQAGQYQHTPPTLEALEASEAIHPQLKAVIRRGYDIFVNTQQFRGRYVFNDLNCRSCHPGGGRDAWAGPVWPAATTFPDFRGKNWQVNSLEERISGCFAYSLNGIPPAYGSDDMLALVAYHRWLATGAPVYESNIYGRGYAHLGKVIPPATRRDNGKALYEQRCAHCHGEDGAGLVINEQRLLPALWGDNSYNWGSGMSRIFTAAAFIHLNMPSGEAGSLSEQQAWDLALFINSQERPQDPRYDGDARSTRARFLNFHQHSLYGTEVDGRLLGQHDNIGQKPVLRPTVLCAREAPFRDAPKPADFTQGEIPCT